ALLLFEHLLESSADVVAVPALTPVRRAIVAFLRDARARDVVAGDAASAATAVEHPCIGPERRLLADLQLRRPVEVPAVRAIVARGVLLDDGDGVGDEI